MRKILSFIGGLFLILIIVFIFMHFNMRRSFYGRSGYYGGNMMRPGYHMMGYNRPYMHMGIDGYQKLTPEEGKRYLRNREKTLKVYVDYEVDISRKQLEVERELLKENPDWEKIEKLNDEIALMESKAKTEVMKINHETYNE